MGICDNIDLMGALRCWICHPYNSANVGRIAMMIFSLLWRPILYEGGSESIAADTHILT